MGQELEKNSLLDFNWEDEDKFFGLPANPTTSDVIKDVKDDIDNDDELECCKKTKAKVEDEEEGEDPFEEFGKTPTQVDNTDPTPQTSLYGNVYKDFKEVGLFKHVEIDEDEEIDEDKFLELSEQEYEAEVISRLTNWAKKELDEDAQAFIKFKKEGGNTQDFFAAYSKSYEIPSGNIEDESYQDTVIRYQLTEEGWDREEIEDRLEYLTSSGKKKAMAQKYDTKLRAEDAKNKEKVLREAEAQKRALKAQEDEYKADLEEVLAETDEIKGLKISAKDKSDILTFLTKKDHKIGADKSITSFQKKLAEVFQDTEKTILLAKLLASDFDFSAFEKKGSTNKTREIKNDLEQRKGLRSFNSGSSSKGSSLADIFN